MSISNPEKKPINIPSFFPLINPNAETTMISRLGPIPAKESVRNVVVCNTKQIEIIKNKTIFLSIYSDSLPVSLSFVITNTSSRCSKSTTGVIVPIFVRLLELFSILAIYPIRIPC